MQTRQATRKILEMLEEGLLDGPDVLRACLNYMSEDDVADMARANDFFDLDEDEDEEDDL